MNKMENLQFKIKYLKSILLLFKDMENFKKFVILESNSTNYFSN